MVIDWKDVEDVFLYGNRLEDTRGEEFAFMPTRTSQNYVLTHESSIQGGSYAKTQHTRGQAVHYRPNGNQYDRNAGLGGNVPMPVFPQSVLAKNLRLCTSPEVITLFKRNQKTASGEKKGALEYLRTHTLERGKDGPTEVSMHWFQARNKSHDAVLCVNTMHIRQPENHGPIEEVWLWAPLRDLTYKLFRSTLGETYSDALVLEMLSFAYQETESLPMNIQESKKFVKFHIPANYERVLLYTNWDRGHLLRKRWKKYSSMPASYPDMKASSREAAIVDDTSKCMFNVECFMMVMGKSEKWCQKKIAELSKLGLRQDLTMQRNKRKSGSIKKRSKRTRT